MELRAPSLAVGSVNWVFLSRLQCTQQVKVQSVYMHRVQLYKEKEASYKIFNTILHPGQKAKDDLCRRDIPHLAKSADVIL